MTHVNIVTSDRGWILENLATQISSRLPYVTFGNGVDTEAVIQYYVTFSCRYRRISPIEVGYFAHLEPEGEANDKFFRVASEVDWCISHSHLYAGILREHGISNVTTISPGVDLAQFSPKIRIGIIGRTYHTGRKGEHLVDQVMNIPEIEWYFTGEGWPNPPLNLAGDVLPELYRRLDYVLVPSLYEGGPMSVVEALACGTEVISPPIGWVPEFPHIEYKVGDATDLRRVLMEIVEKKRKLRESVLDRTWDAWAEGHDKVFRDLAALNGLNLTNPKKTRHRYPNRTALVLHGSEGSSPGGPTVRVPRLGRELRELGSEAQVVRHPSTDFARYEVAHVFNSWGPKTALDAIRRAKGLGVGVVFSPIFLDLSSRSLWQDALPQIFNESENEIELENRLQRYFADYHQQRASPQPPAEPVPGYHSSVRLMMSLADKVIFLSEREKMRLELIGADTSHGTIVRNPVDSKLFAEADPSIFEQHYGIRDFIICVARQESRKNQLMLMRALQDTNIPLVLVGHAASSDYVKLMERYRTANVHLIERLPPNSNMLASAFAAARAAVLPSWSEGAPLAALEAAAAGASLVLSDESGESEYFGEWARYCDPASASSIRKSVLEAFETKSPEEHKEAQKKFIRNNFNWDRHCSSTREIYRLVREVVTPKVAEQLHTPAYSVSAAQTRIDIVYDVTTTANHKGRWTGIARVEAALAIALQENERVASIRFVAWNNKARTFVEIPFAAIREGRTSNILAHYDTVVVRPMDLPAGAFHLVGGSGWMQNSSYTEGLIAFKYYHKLRLIPIIHDVIPVRFPFWFDEGYAPTFNHNLSILLGNSDAILSISESTKADIEFFANGEVDLFLPEIFTFREGDEISQIPTKERLPDFIDKLRDQEFVLSVGAIHQRKNHKLLYDVWVQLSERMGSRCPKLVLVGGVAWNGQDLARAMQNDRRVQNQILIFEKIDDHALEWLYRNSIFTVYPSLYEGWGLPVSESLRHGKICIASNVSSIPEVAPGLVELLDPLDPAKWLARILFLASSRQARELREATIAASYRHFSWAEASNNLLDCLCTSKSLVPIHRPHTPGTIASLANRLDAARYKRRGWHLTEKWGCWSSEMAATLSLELPEPYVGNAVFIAEVKAFSFPGSQQETRVLVNGTPVGRWTISGTEVLIRHALIPASVLKGAMNVELRLENANLVPIAQVNKSNDSRSVGIGLTRFALADLAKVPHAGTYLGTRCSDDNSIELGRSYDFFKDARSRACLDGEWTSTSVWGAINTDGRPRMSLVIQEAPGEALEVELFLRPVATEVDPLTIMILVNDTPSRAYTFSDDEIHRVLISVTAAIRAVSEPIIIDMVPSDIRSPREVGVGSAGVAFGFGLFSMRVLTPSLQHDPYAVTYEVGKNISFSSLATESPSVRLSSIPGPWHSVEPGGVWSAGKVGLLSLRLGQPWLYGLALNFEARAFGPASSEIEAFVSANGHRIGTVSLSSELNRAVELPLPVDAVGKDGRTLIEIIVPTASSPAKLGTGTDERILGVRLSALSLRPAAVLSTGIALPFASRAVSGERQPSDAYVQGKWYPPEPSGRWSQESQGELTFVRSPFDDGQAFFVSSRVLGAAVDAPVYVDLLVNGCHTDTWLFWDDQVLLADVRGFAEAVAGSEKVTISFRSRNSRSPRALGLSDDPRELGVLVTGCVLLDVEQGVDEAAALLSAAGCNVQKRMERDLASYGSAGAIDVAPLGLSDALSLVRARGDIRIVDVLGSDGSNKVFVSGWYDVEPDGRWSGAGCAVLHLQVPRVAKSIEVVARVFGTGAGSVGVMARVANNGEHLFQFRSDDFGLISIPLDGSEIDEINGIALTFRALAAVSPKHLGMGDDDRPLGVFVRYIGVQVSTL
ncbi:glycosyltransferase [Muricoccus aerilatus]|uniref:glycosyltransferase n=1 Tax=Muricoccus aerilatus TaxID=452982 RepID=UPI0012EB3AC5|nr:glycosyltransferase [Roseomonas aerilata]